MHEVVKASNGRGTVVLGKDAVCSNAGHRCWGEECKTLMLKEDGLYHCEDCGLVYLKDLVRYTKMEKVAPTLQCECAMLGEVIEWWFDECHGYECPSSRRACLRCGRHYETPPTAELDKQQGEGGRKYVSDRIRWKEEEHAQELSNIRDQVSELIESLAEVSPEERRSLLAPLLS